MSSPFVTPIQELQFVDKYARFNHDLGRRETWPETVTRVINFFASELPVKLTVGEWEDLRQAMFNLEAMPSMRIVQMAGPALQRCHVGAYNCLGVETEFITSAGPRRFSSYSDGDEILVPSHTGELRKARVRKFGKGTLRRLRIYRGRTSYDVWATDNHRWIKADGQTATTSELHGQALALPPFGAGSWAYDAAPPDEKLAWAYGYIYGDGTISKKDGVPTHSMVRLCGKDKERFLPRFIELGFNYSEPDSFGGEPMVYTGGYLKEGPGKAAERRLIVAFVRGLLDADGAKVSARGNANQFSSIQVTGTEKIDTVRDLLSRAGVYVTREDQVAMKTNLGPRSDVTVRFGLFCGAGTRSNSYFRIELTDETREDDLWCLQVDQDESFVLAGGIVTRNCAYLPLDSWEAFGELLYVLMQGTGCGFSVEIDYIDSLPRIKRQKDQKARKFTVPDTTIGWCNALTTGLAAWSNGEDIEYDFSRIRPQGAVLKTKGGRASGPEPLRQLLHFAKERLLKSQGRRLDPIDAHDIACFCGHIVQVGGVRRAATISLSDLDDRDMRDAKSGQYWLHNVQRAMANNSVAYSERPKATVFMEEWLALAKSGTGERGIFNRGGLKTQLPARRKKSRDFGINPCGEIILRQRQFCNLSIAIARPGDTQESLARKVRLAAIFGTLQSMLTKFQYLPESWQQNCEEERLLGVDITGQMDCEILRPETDYKRDLGFAGDSTRQRLLDSLAKVAIDTNAEYAKRFGIPQSAAVTCVKPSGNSAQLFNCSSGLHPRYAKYYIRRVRIGGYTPIAKLLKDAGVPWAPEVGQEAATATVLVFDFPVAAPHGAPTRHDLSALQQLENWLDWKDFYTEHNPSVSIYVSDDEWPAVGAWVYDHFDRIGGLSFIPRDGGAYELAPYEEITQKEYTKLLSNFPKIDFSKLPTYEKEDSTEINREFACSGEKGCEL
jgi:ribonucleoside-triphosphate reductase